MKVRFGNPPKTARGHGKRSQHPTTSHKLMLRKTTSTECHAMEVHGVPSSETPRGPRSGVTRKSVTLLSSTRIVVLMFTPLVKIMVCGSCGDFSSSRKRRE